LQLLSALVSMPMLYVVMTLTFIPVDLAHALLEQTIIHTPLMWTGCGITKDALGFVVLGCTTTQIKEIVRYGQSPPVQLGHI
jgi:hypothetical protein